MKRLVISTGIIIIALTGCRSSKPVEPMAVITGTTWQLSTFKGNNAEASYFGNKVPYISFSNDNKISGSGGCNTFGGSYNINDEGGINISQLFSTKMACEGGNGEGEFLSALEKVNMTKADAEKLVLMSGVEEVMTFVPQK